MNRFNVMLVVGMAASACASDSDALSSKQLAADIQYDNAGTGLVSTNVQDAIDDVVAMAQAQDARHEALKPIACRYQTVNLVVPAPTSANGYKIAVPHTFTANECGGVVPDASYIGALTGFRVCSSTLYSIRVVNAGEPDGPGVTAIMYGDCQGPAEYAALFFKI